MNGVPEASAADASSGSTIPTEPPASWPRLERRLQVVSFTFVIGVVLLAALGALGVRTGIAAAAGGGYALEVVHAEVTRPGLATPFIVDLSTVDGSALPGEVTVRVDSSYLAMFDFNGLEPTPTSSFNTEQWTWWLFDLPPGQTSLRIDLDGRLEPAVQWARLGSVALEIDGESPVSVDFTTWVMP
ncbi:MAG: hypothetical protein ACRDWS_16390 [Acidimicrobiia bacterium]